MAQGDFVYFFFRETAVEYINCGKVSGLAIALIAVDRFRRLSDVPQASESLE